MELTNSGCSINKTTKDKMAKVITRNQTRQRIAPRVEEIEEEQEQIETKAEKKVVVTKGLAALMTNWKNAFGKAEAFFPQAVQYIIDEQTTKDELKQALIEFRGLEVPSLNNELSTLWRVKDYPDEVEAYANGEINEATGRVWTVRDLRAVGRKPQENKAPGKSVEDKFVELMGKVARYGITEVKLGLNDFIAQARVSYREEHATVTGQKAKAAAAAKEANDEEEGLEEVED